MKRIRLIVIFFILYLNCYSQNDTIFNLVKYALTKDSTLFNDFAKRYNEVVFIEDEIFSKTDLILKLCPITFISKDDFYNRWKKTPKKILGRYTKNTIFYKERHTLYFKLWVS